MSHAARSGGCRRVFEVELLASNLRDPRTVRVVPNGDIFVAESGPGRIRVLRAATERPSPAATTCSRQASTIRLA
jgi:glucose/arabinose dehydrogenase